MKLIPLAAFAVLTALLLGPAAAQQATPEAHDHTTTPPQQATGMMDHDKMMASMKAADARLEALVQAMKSASADDKVGVMQELLAALVANQVETHRHMSTMHDHMMPQTPHK